ncbi:MAG TPA: nitroreductase, partial [Parvularculaceae bacterium]|nr:nitroreductase [Parvularculaceae bacterium]
GEEKCEKGAMNVSDALKTRISVRAFLPTLVEEGLIREILEIAKFAPSGGNVQPWQVHVVLGPARDRLVATVKKAIAEDPLADESDFPIYPPSLWEPYRTRRYALGEAMYELLGIPREDKPARLAHVARNFEFFGAPAGLFFSLDRNFNPNQWAHLGMLMLAVSLVAEEKGLATCMQESWMLRARTVSKFLGLSETQQLFCGMALGYADPDAPVNKLRSERAPLEEFATFMKK